MRIATVTRPDYAFAAYSASSVTTQDPARWKVLTHEGAAVASKAKEDIWVMYGGDSEDDMMLPGWVDADHMTYWRHAVQSLVS